MRKYSSFNVYNSFLHFTEKAVKPDCNCSLRVWYRIASHRTIFNQNAPMPLRNPTHVRSDLMMIQIKYQNYNFKNFHYLLYSL